MIEPLLLSAQRISTYRQQQHLKNASSFFFERNDSLFLVTSRHVVVDEATNHYPDRIEIELHTDADNLAQSAGFSISRYRDGVSLWRQGGDAAGTSQTAPTSNLTGGPPIRGRPR